MALVTGPSGQTLSRQNRRLARIIHGFVATFARTWGVAKGYDHVLASVANGSYSWLATQLPYTASNCARRVGRVFDPPQTGCNPVLTRLCSRNQEPRSMGPWSLLNKSLLATICCASTSLPASICCGLARLFQQVPRAHAAELLAATAEAKIGCLSTHFRPQPLAEIAPLGLAAQ
jgi:hypothetical protein